MAVGRLQVTIGAAGAQPTQFTATVTPVCQAIIEADDGNSHAAWVGPSDVTSANGIALAFSATVPGRIVIGPFSENLFSLSELYVAGTEAEKVNILYVQH